MAGTSKISEPSKSDSFTLKCQDVPDRTEEAISELDENWDRLSRVDAFTPSQDMSQHAACTLARIYQQHHNPFYPAIILRHFHLSMPSSERNGRTYSVIQKLNQLIEKEGAEAISALAFSSFDVRENSTPYTSTQIYFSLLYFLGTQWDEKRKTDPSSWMSAFQTSVVPVGSDNIHLQYKVRLCSDSPENPGCVLRVQATDEHSYQKFNLPTRVQFRESFRKRLLDKLEAHEMNPHLFEKILNDFNFVEAQDALIVFHQLFAEESRDNQIDLLRGHGILLNKWGKTLPPTILEDALSLFRQFTESGQVLGSLSQRAVEVLEKLLRE